MYHGTKHRSFNFVTRWLAYRALQQQIPEITRRLGSPELSISNGVTASSCFAFPDSLDRGSPGTRSSARGHKKSLWYRKGRKTDKHRKGRKTDKHRKGRKTDKQVERQTNTEKVERQTNKQTDRLIIRQGRKSRQRQTRPKHDVPGGFEPRITASECTAPLARDNDVFTWQVNDLWHHNVLTQMI